MEVIQDQYEVLNDLVKVMHDLVLVLHHLVRAVEKRGTRHCLDLRLRSKQ